MTFFEAEMVPAWESLCPLFLPFFCGIYHIFPFCFGVCDMTFILSYFPSS